MDINLKGIIKKENWMVKLSIIYIMVRFKKEFGRMESPRRN